MELKDILKDKSVYFDTNIFIYLLEGSETFKNAISDIEHLISQKTIEIWSSDLVYAELIPPHAKTGNKDAITHILDFLSIFNISEVSKDTFIHAGILRGETGMKTPDSLHVASAVATECDIFLTNDKGIEVPKDMEKLFISDFI